MNRIRLLFYRAEHLNRRTVLISFFPAWRTQHDVAASVIGAFCNRNAANKWNPFRKVTTIPLCLAIRNLYFKRQHVRLDGDTIRGSHERIFECVFNYDIDIASAEKIFATSIIRFMRSTSILVMRGVFLIHARVCDSIDKPKIRYQMKRVFRFIIESTRILKPITAQSMLL